MAVSPRTENDTMDMLSSDFVRACSLAELRAKGRLVVHGRHSPILVVYDGQRVFALDNRCPHMGFPLDRGSVRDGILTCHWHHARFDLCSGGTFDQWADDVQTYPVHEIDGGIFVDLAPRLDPAAHYRKRLQDGLERNIRLLIGKAVIGLVEAAGPVEPFRLGLSFG